VIMRAISFFLILSLLGQSAMGAVGGPKQVDGGVIRNGSGKLNINSSGTATTPNGTYNLLGDSLSQSVTSKDIDGGTASNTSRLTLPKAATATLNGLTRKQGTVAYDTDRNKAVIDNGTALVPVGSGSGGGVNFIGQTTAWSADNTDDRDLESSVGNWLAFADAAATIPVDLTGGSPTVTCTRSTTNPLDGAASLLITKGASNLQGNGCSVVFNVQPAYQGGTATITAALNVSSGSIVQGDVKLFIYDVTNSKLITPSNNDVLSGPTLTATFPLTARAATPANQQYRLGVYFASTSATAVNLQLDNFSVSPGQAAYGMAGSNWISYTPTFTGFGTVSTSNMYYRRVGDSVQVHGTFVSGTVTGVQAQVSFPTGLTVDSSKSPSSTYYAAGQFARNTAPSSAGAFYAITEGGQSTLSFGIESTSLTPLTPQNASAIFITGDTISIYATVPIAGWDAGVSISPSQTYKISSYLAAGSRVTSTPTALGQYRSYFKTINSSAGTDGAPTTAPNIADGVKIASVPYASAGATDPNRFEIFVGQNKNVKILWYSGTGRTGILDTTHNVESSTFEVGTMTNYDPTTGVVTVDAMYQTSSSVTTRRVGYGVGTAGAAAGSQGTGYFDIVVSDNALAVGMDATQVISNNKGERIERATLSLTSASVASIASQSGSWLSSVSASSSVVTVNFTAGIFSAAPSCTITCDNSNGGGAATGEPLTAISASTFNFGCVNASSALTNGGKAYLICMGPR
jgi:hypothetical protein